MYGSFWGTLLAALYLAAFAAGGVFIAGRVFYRETVAFRLMMGGAAGLILLQWLPALFSFFMGFGLWSHFAAFLLLALLTAGVGLLLHNRPALCIKRPHKGDVLMLVLAFGVFAVFTAALMSHTVPLFGDGSMHTGQCTYGDMNMHLGFITSIARQGAFPPEYSILPGTKLCYPFLCDSISSSLYIFGCSLRFAYIAPMLLAMATVMAGVYYFAFSWLKDKSKATLAWTLFFLCGGFGFIYFMDRWRTEPQNFLRIFSEFYQTPTNLTAEGNIRWVNVIADMLLPQRATLFGWALLFPTLTVLYKAVFENRKEYFIPAGVLAGGMPMVHTHSFLAVALISACWLLAELTKRVMQMQNGVKTVKAAYAMAAAGTAAGFVPMIICAVRGAVPDSAAIAFPALGLVAGLFAAGVVLLARCLAGGYFKEFARTWLIYLAIVLALSLPQLITWTFAQVGRGTMLRGHFNWGNLNDSYVWFYIKNVGIVALLAIPAFLHCKKEFPVAAPSLLILFICEFVVFQPNVYDNNKLLYVAYAIAACLTAGYMVDIYRLLREKNIGGRRVIAAATVFLCVFSAVLTLGREVVSDYQLYAKEQVQAAEFIEKNTPADSVILTGTQHNNAVSSLTGRNIVCGAGTFLYYHGVDYQGREADVKTMYSDLENAEEMLQRYNVDYVYISPQEVSAYRTDAACIKDKYPLVYSRDGVYIYAVSRRAQEACAGE